MKKIIACMIFLATSSFASTDTKKSLIEITTKKSKDSVTLTFATKTTDGFVINADGPWKLEIQEIKNATAATKEYKRSAWNAEIAGFDVPVTLEKNASTVEIKYKMIAFVCTKDKSLCLREVTEKKESVKI